MKYISIVLVAFLFCISGCDFLTKKHRPKKKPIVKPQKTSDVGVADAADYATGVTQISTMNKSEKKLEDIYADNKKRKEEALKDKK